MSGTSRSTCGSARWAAVKLAEVFKFVGRDPIERLIANHETTQTELAKVASRRGKRAERHLKAHKHDGHSRITVETGLSDVNYGHIDHFVVLDDSRGQDAVLSIEFGRRPNSEGKGEMKPVKPLRTAFPELER